MEAVSQIFHILLMLGSGILLWFALRNLYQNRMTRQRALKTEAKVISSDLTVSHSNRSDGRVAQMYSADIAYEYEVQGHRYEGTDIYIRSKAKTSEEWLARDILKEFPAGKVCDIFYDRDNPEVSWLKDKVFVGDYMFFGISLAFTLLGSWLVFS